MNNKDHKVLKIVIGLELIVGIILVTALVISFHMNAYAEESIEYLTGGEYSEIFENATCDDFEALEQCVFWEAARADCPFEVDVAVVETILNRCLDPDWPDTIYGVIHDRRWGKQFCSGEFTAENDGQYEVISDAIQFVLENGRTVLPSTKYQFFSRKKQKYCKNYILIGNPEKKYQYMWFGEGKE